MPAKRAVRNKAFKIAAVDRMIGVTFDVEDTNATIVRLGFGVTYWPSR